MIKAFSHFLHANLTEYEIANLACEIERVDCCMSGGKQDQYAAAFGGLNFIEFPSSDHAIVSPLRIKREIMNSFEEHILLYFTGISRESASIINAQIKAANSHESDPLRAMHDLKQTSLEMRNYLLRGEVKNALSLIGSSWGIKKKLAHSVSNSNIEKIALAATAAGADGLKISGAGGGGFMMIIVEPLKRYQVMRALEGLGGTFYKFRFTDEGVESWETS
jgi:D-glycero-alpha-D-manno-heptose-7-phosphate kinase